MTPRPSTACGVQSNRITHCPVVHRRPDAWTMATQFDPQSAILSPAPVDNRPAVGKIANMKADLITRFRSVSEDGKGIEMVVWRVPAPVPPSAHPYKYRLVYLVEGRRVIGLDNERGKGDHMHKGEGEVPYEFVDVDRLIEDFIREVEAWPNGH